MSDITKNLTIWTVYANPLDYPGKFVLRATEIGPDLWIHHPPVAVRNTLDQVRAHLPPHLRRIPRSPLDDPVIVECWI